MKKSPLWKHWQWLNESQKFQNKNIILAIYINIVLRFSKQSKDGAVYIYERSSGPHDLPLL